MCSKWCFHLTLSVLIISLKYFFRDLVAKCMSNFFANYKTTITTKVAFTGSTHCFLFVTGGSTPCCVCPSVPPPVTFFNCKRFLGSGPEGNEVL